MAKQFFKDLPDTSTPLTASRLNGLLDGEEAMGNLVVGSIRTKNMFDKSVVSTVKTFNSSGDIIALTEGFVQEIYIPVKSSTKYTLSTNGDYTGTTNYRLIFCEYNSSKGFIQRDIALSGTSYTITTTANTKYIRIGGNTVFIDALQLEEGDTATPYSPYQELDMPEINSYVPSRNSTYISNVGYSKIIKIGKIVIFYINANISQSVPNNTALFYGLPKVSRADRALSSVAFANNDTVSRVYVEGTELKIDGQLNTTGWCAGQIIYTTD